MRVNHVLIVLGLVTTVLPLAAQSADAILKREDARIAALRSGQGREAFYSSDYININPQGVISIGFQPGAPNPALYTKDSKVVAVTQNGAVVTMLQGPRPKTAAVPSDTDPDRALDIWANEQGTWRLVARQAVWVRPPDSATPSRVKAPKVASYQPKGPAESEILKAQQDIEDAFARHDAAAYERLTLPEFIRIGERGQVAPRAEWVKANIVDNKAARVLPLFDDVRVRVYGDVAVTTHRHIGLDAEGTTTERPLRMMRAWVRRDGGWKLAATISTIVWPTQPAAK